MRFAKTTAVAVALAVGGLSAPISSSLTATDAAAEQRVVRKHVEVRPNGNRIVTKRIVTRRPGVRVVDGRYFYGGRYYDENEALAAGLIGFAKSVACDYGKHGIRANVLSPGPIRVHYSPNPGDAGYDYQINNTFLRRQGDCREVANAALFLASDMSGYVTGHNIPVDGGTKAGAGWFFSPTARRFVNRPKTL